MGLLPWPYDTLATSRPTGFGTRMDCGRGAGRRRLLDPVRGSHGRGWLDGRAGLVTPQPSPYDSRGSLFVLLTAIILLLVTAPHTCAVWGRSRVTAGREAVDNCSPGAGRALAVPPDAAFGVGGCDTARMPEGPEIRRAADALAAAVVGRRSPPSGSMPGAPNPTSAACAAGASDHHAP